MLVKVRLPRGAASGRIAGQQAPLLSILSGLVILCAFSCLMFAMWRLTSDLGWTDTFVISEGFLSHWQVWMALTFAFGAVGIRLNKYSQHGAQPAFSPASPEPLAQAASSGMEAEDLLEPRAR